MQNRIHQGFFVLILCFTFLSTSLWADSKEWPSDISSKDRKFLYEQIKPALKKMRKNKEKISVGLLDGKFLRGDVIKVGKTKFTIQDYKKKQYTLKYKRIKAKYLSKIIPNKKQSGKVLHFLGLIALQAKNKRHAKAYFERAEKLKYSDAGKYLARVKEELENAENSAEEEREKSRALADKKRRELEEEEEKIRQEKARSKIKNIVSLGSDQLDVKANSFPGKYTIFKFGAPW